MPDSPVLVAAFFRTEAGREPVGHRMIILHGFIKKTRATPDQEIELAERRWKTWKNEQGAQSE